MDIASRVAALIELFRLQELHSWNFYMAQIFGLVAFIVNVIGVMSGNRKRIIVCNTISNSSCVIQYLLLGIGNPIAIPGAISSTFAVLRNIVFSTSKKRVPLWGLFIYFALAIAINIPFFNGWISIIPLFNIIIFGYAIWQNNVQRLRKINILTSFTAMVYNIYTLALISFIDESIAFSAGMYTYIKHIYSKYERAKGHKLFIKGKKKRKHK